MASFDFKSFFRIPTAAQRLAGLGLRPDLYRAALKMVSDERSEQEIRRLELLLNDTETVIAVVEGVRSRQLGFLALTTERILFRQHGASIGTAEIATLGEISQVNDRARGMTGRVSIECGPLTIEVDKILGVQAAQFAKDVREQQLSPGAPLHDPMAELAELRKNRAAGAITEKDFQKSKRRLLDEL